LPRPPERIHHYRTVSDLMDRVLYKLATWPPEKLAKAFSKWKKPSPKGDIIKNGAAIF